MNTDNILNKMLGKAKKELNSYENDVKFIKPKPIKTKTISGKKVQIFNNQPIPKHNTIKKAYDKIPDDTSIPLQFMTREQYKQKYIHNQQEKNGVTYTDQQIKQFMEQKKPKYQNIIGRYTTKQNPYYKPAVVVFNDPDNYSNITGKKFKKLVWHEYGHELAENKNLGLNHHHHEEYFADRIAEKGLKNTPFNDEKSKNKILKEIQQDNYSKNMAFTDKTGFPVAEYGWDKRYRVTDRQISPDTYMRLAKKTQEDSDGIKKTSLKEYEKESLHGIDYNRKQGLKEAIVSEEPLVDRPFIETKDGQLYEQEGRHRAFFAREAGIEKIPVRFVESTETEKITPEEYENKVDEHISKIESDNQSKNKTFYRGVGGFEKKLYDLKNRFEPHSSDEDKKLWVTPNRKIAERYSEQHGDSYIAEMDLEEDKVESAPGRSKMFYTKEDVWSGQVKNIEKIN